VGGTRVRVGVGQAATQNRLGVRTGDYRLSKGKPQPAGKARRVMVGVRVRVRAK